MKIIAKTKGLSKVQLYKLMTPTEYTNMSEKVGEVLKVKSLVVHEETDRYSAPKKVLSIETEEGEIVVSASQTLIMELEKLIVIFGVNSINELAIIDSETRSGNDVLSCRLVGLEDMI